MAEYHNWFRPSAAECPYCGAEIGPAALIRPGHCGRADCAHQHVLAGVRKEEERRDQEDADRMSAAKAGALEQLSLATRKLGCQADDMTVAVVPFQGEPLVPLPSERRLEFVNHLQAIIDEAFSTDPDDFDDPNYSQNEAPEDPVVFAACATCKGRCCKLGAKTNAFLKPQNVTFQRRQNTDLTPEDVLNRYTQMMPEVSVQGACVFQGETGCTLPRDFRSDVCNSFYCRDIHGLFKNSAANGGPVAIVAINDEKPEAVGAFSKEKGYLPIFLD